MPGKTRSTGPAKQIDQECFNQIVRVMAEEDCSTTPTLRDFSEKPVTRIATRRFNRHLRFRGESANI